MNNRVFDELMTIAGWPIKLGEQVKIFGQDPVLRTRFRIGEMAAGVHAACGVAVSNIWELRTGHRQQVEVNVQAGAASLQSNRYITIDGSPPTPSSGFTIEFHLTRDGRWFLVHAAYASPRLHEGVLSFLGCDDNDESVADAVSHWEAETIEDAFADVGICGGIARSAEEWATHPQGITLKNLPVLEVIKIGESPPEPFGAGDRPLSGIRVLDLTIVLAGPTCARTLAEHGADVLRLAQSDVGFTIDTGHGKRAAHLDLHQDSQSKTLWKLIRDADVFAQNYRLGAVANLGFSPEALAKVRPGIVYTSMNCYGHEGPWRGRRGFETNADAVTGLSKEQGEPGKPQRLPATVSDYTTGYLAAFGTLVALSRRAREGGSYLVRASLTQSAMLLNRLGRVAEAEAAAKDVLLAPEEISRLTMESDTPFGRITHLAPVVKLSETPTRWSLPTAPIGLHEPVWLD
ncbi:CoA transferase [Chloroflexota bacterium]